MEKVDYYNELFSQLQSWCKNNNCCNAFAFISLQEIIELNYLLDRLLIFVENIDKDELEDFECGNEVLKLYRLVDTLMEKDL